MVTSAIGVLTLPRAQEEFDIAGELAKGSFGVVYKAVRKSEKAAGRVNEASL